MSVDAILNQAEELTLEQRAELLQRLEAGLIEAGWHPEFELTEEVKTMLDQRIAASDAKPGAKMELGRVLEPLKPVREKLTSFAGSLTRKPSSAVGIFVTEPKAL